MEDYEAHRKKLEKYTGNVSRRKAFLKRHGLKVPTEARTRTRTRSRSRSRSRTRTRTRSRDANPKPNVTSALGRACAEWWTASPRQRRSRRCCGSRRPSRSRPRTRPSTCGGGRPPPTCRSSPRSSRAHSPVPPCREHARQCSPTGTRPPSAAQGADRPRLAAARGSPRRALPLREGASGQQPSFSLSSQPCELAHAPPQRFVFDRFMGKYCAAAVGAGFCLQEAFVGPRLRLRQPGALHPHDTRTTPTPSTSPQLSQSSSPHKHPARALTLYSRWLLPP